MKKWIVIGMVLGCLSALWGDQPGEQEWSMTKVGMIFKFKEARETILEKIRKADETIAKANSLIARAQNTGNKAAEEIALRALQKAQENKRQNELKKLQIDKNIAYVQNRMAEHSGIDAKIGGMVTNHSGRVRVVSGKPPYEAVAMDGERPGYFEEGDTIETYGNSRAEVQFLDGRGSMTIGEYSRVKMEQKDPLSEALVLSKGKIHAMVDKAEAFEGWLEKQAQMAADDPNKLLMHDLGAIRAWIKKKSKKFEVRTGGGTASVRGTTFTMSADEAGGTMIELIEGELAVTNVKTSGETILKGGEKMTISAEGTVHIEPLKLPSHPWWQP